VTTRRYPTFGRLPSGVPGLDTVLGDVCRKLEKVLAVGIPLSFALRCCRA
jgi:hypothetical protein